MSEYEKGRKAEEKAMRSLRARGFEVIQYPGSKGPGATDLRATYPGGPEYGVQVKRVREGEEPSLSREERSRLRRIREIPVIAIVRDKGPVEFRYFRTNHPVRFRKKRPGKKAKARR